jgi:hypothetical protein
VSLRVAGLTPIIVEDAAHFVQTGWSEIEEAPDAIILGGGHGHAITPYRMITVPSGVAYNTSIDR